MIPKEGKMENVTDLVKGRALEDGVEILCFGEGSETFFAVKMTYVEAERLADWLRAKSAGAGARMSRHLGNFPGYMDGGC